MSCKTDKFLPVAHFCPQHFAREGLNLARSLILGTPLNQPQIRLQYEIRVRLVLVLQRAGRLVRHFPTAFMLGGWNRNKSETRKRKL